eukprot:CAMPEP_0179246996 /NCGR_PEP_ID=MMETSP0797-20121207/19382_1 /TAXON_ID=47934 /ORGANISM="Dinophysis acuminata, Strain DAEP01" /LENGTH=76 /DNA_ID=CAMNT_0020954603 /DNA_START=393 /DNA_END=619 /DNA_ORIENTATION=-
MGPTRAGQAPRHPAPGPSPPGSRRTRSQNDWSPRLCCMESITALDHGTPQGRRATPRSRPGHTRQTAATPWHHRAA